MLEILCGSKNIERILLFLFVNGKCYGTQLHKMLGRALTPLQKALERLEKGGIILSNYEGKTRLYQFNPSYPLYQELEGLLKKSYMLLPTTEKKKYYVIKQPQAVEGEEGRLSLLLKVWESLNKVTKVSFHAVSRVKEGGWNGKGQGEVSIFKERGNVLIFQEKGSWKGQDEREIDFNTGFRWTLDRVAGVISLERLHRDKERPIFLFNLAPVSKNTLASVDSHLCGEDAYFGQLHFTLHNIRVNWRAIGPKKNEEMNCYYC